MLKNTTIVATLTVAALLGGCSVHQAEMNVGPMATLGNMPMRSSGMQLVMKKSNATSSDILTGNCPLNGTNKCGPYYNWTYTGPGAIYAYTAYAGHGPQDPKTIQYLNNGAVIAESAGIGLASAVPFWSGVGIVGSILQIGAAPQQSGKTSLAAYNEQVRAFQADKVLWIAKYYSSRQWRAGLNGTAHLAIDLSDGVRSAGWSSGMVGGSLYKISSGFWEASQDGLFQWHWVTGKPEQRPDILPVQMTWIVQPWKKASEPFYLVNKKDPRYPFMDLATVEYRIHKGFDVPKWIQEHTQQLQGWMVIYPSTQGAEVWESGKTAIYPVPRVIQR
ncbi:hypothetical protein HAP93_05545 [Acidithiobacillus ferriphilus]|uniref:hypothetical protein n=1 Tax=Acidithiobacillus ferriphilus TaxID=1689834 RepID=UPI001C05F647|nr:hypothetical protein [Acidithiobacillus ferriphilus]MBU2785236.1 hypothetical protein [Acidithiobacillus ferriphilus]